ncbi:MAG: hypothetical protein KJ737_15000 [Proteobacteria bacterium]|nr:hypothetical protein [Pseudomonadota bacterium]
MTKLIIFLIILWQIRTVLKKVSEAATKSKPDAQPNKKASWQDKLKDVADKIKTEMEKARQQTDTAAKRTPGWDQILTGKKMPLPMEKKEDDKPPVRPTAPSLEKAESALSSKEELWKLTDIRKQESEKTERPGKKKRFQRSNINQMTDLKKAVVWSEILSPPVSMRDESHPLRD